MVSGLTLLAVVAVVSVSSASEDLDVVSVSEPDNHLHDVKLHSTTDIIKQMVAKRCLHQYSMPCLKLDLARLIDRLSTSGTNYQLLPGVSVSSQPLTNHSHPRADDLPLELAQALARDSRSHHPLDDFLADKVTRYLGSLTLSVNLAEPMDYISSTSRALKKGVTPTEGRKSGGRRPWAGMLAAGLFSGGTLLALAMSALAALAGKALMTALLSLLLSALAALRGSGGGGGGGKTTYEIITKPVVSHEHSHSSEVQHGGHLHGLAYGRSMDFKPVDLGHSHEPMTLAYRAHNPTVSGQSPTLLQRQQ